MTNEEIKQNAEAYALKRTLVSTDSFHGMAENYIAGAHSRDEEIKEYQKHVQQLKEYLRDIKAAVDSFFNVYN